MDLRSPLTAELRAAIEAAMDRHAVPVFPGQDLDDDRQMAFGDAFGPIERTAASSARRCRGASCAGTRVRGG